MVKAILEIISLITQPILAIGVFLAYWQILVIKRDNLIKLKREARILALTQAKIFATEIIPHMDSNYEDLRKIIKLKKVKLNNFFLSEILSNEGDIKKEFFIIKDYLNKNYEIWKSFLKTANELESLSMYFMKNMADEEVVFSSVSQTFCDYVEQNYYLYCSFRNDNKFNFYENTIELYKIWSERIKKYDLEKIQENINQQINKIEDKKIKPLGT